MPSTVTLTLAQQLVEEALSLAIAADTQHQQAQADTLLQALLAQLRARG
jgi:hypothetical protein